MISKLAKRAARLSDATKFKIVMATAVATAGFVWKAALVYGDFLNEQRQISKRLDDQDSQIKALWRRGANPSQR